MGMDVNGEFFVLIIYGLSSKAIPQNSFISIPKNSINFRIQSFNLNLEGKENENNQKKFEFPVILIENPQEMEINKSKIDKNLFISPQVNFQTSF